MHPWHDYPIDETSLADRFPVVIEVPMGSKNKYELDKRTGLLRLDRVLYSAVYYPANYGFVPRTFCDDGDPLDVLVLGQEAVYPLTVVDVRAIGVMKMRDDKGIDDKLIAVSIGDRLAADVVLAVPSQCAHARTPFAADVCPGELPAAEIVPRRCTRRDRAAAAQCVCRARTCSCCPSALR